MCGLNGVNNGYIPRKRRRQDGGVREEIRSDGEDRRGREIFGHERGRGTGAFSDLEKPDLKSYIYMSFFLKKIFTENFMKKIKKYEINEKKTTKIKSNPNKELPHTSPSEPTRQTTKSVIRQPTTTEHRTQNSQMPNERRTQTHQSHRTRSRKSSDFEIPTKIQTAALGEIRSLDSHQDSISNSK